MGPLKRAGLLPLLLPLLLLYVGSPPPAEAATAGLPLVTIGSFAPDQAPEPPQGLRVVSYNLHGPPGDRIDRMLELLDSHPALEGAVVFALQEVNRDHAGSARRDVARELAERLRTHFVYAVELEHDSGGGVRGLALLSRYPIVDVTRTVLPVEGPGGRRRIALGGTVELGSDRLRVYTTHLETRISVEERGEQIGGLLAEAERFETLPTVIAGDFNTFTGGARKKMFEMMQAAGYECPLPGTKKTFQRMFFLRLKLDWFWTKGLRPLAADVEEDVTVSDHRPLWLDLELEGAPGGGQR